MITDENLNVLYNGVIENKELTTQELYSYGFTPKDLSELIEQGKLERVKRGIYKFTSFEDLYQFGNNLNKEKNFDNAFKCFVKCYEMNSTHQDTALQLFLSYIIRKDYDNAFIILETLEKSTNPSDIADFNLYLYLLNIITEVPDKYKDYAKYIRYEDIKLNDNDSKENKVFEHNKIRNSLVCGKVFFAMSKLKELISISGVNLRVLIIKNLMGQVIGLENLSKKTVLEALKNKDYDKVINFLENKKERQNLNKYDIYALELAKIFLDIKNNGIISPKTVSFADDFFKAVDEKDYELALHLYKEYAKKYNLVLEESAFYILLEDICTLIQKIRLPEEEIVQNVDNELTTNQEEKSKVEKTPDIKFSDIVTLLMKGDLENSFRFLRKYLCFINRSEYEFLIVDLIKLSLIENDFAFTKPMLILTYLCKDNYDFDISIYIQEFYIKLSENKFDEARIYLDIISKANKLGQNFILTDSLLKVLENTETMLNYKRDNKILDSVDSAYENSQHYVEPVVENKEIEEKKEKIEPVVEKTETIALKNISKRSKIISPEPVLDDDRILIKNKYDLLLSDGMVLLKPMNEARINNLLKIIREYDDIDAFTIGDENSKQLVLRYKSTSYKYLDFKELRIKGKDAYNKKEYEECIKIQLELLKHGHPKSSVYAYIGLSYMKLFNIDKAIDYLKVATTLSKKENGIYDFTDLISSLDGSVDREDKKTFVHMKKDDFEDKNDNFGLGDVSYITEYIYNSGLDVENACKQLQLNEEEIIILMLVYARDFYKQKEYEKGDQFLKYVEKVKNKSPHIYKIFREVRTNKKFYKNRTPESEISLSLTLRPKK